MIANEAPLLSTQILPAVLKILPASSLCLRQSQHATYHRVNGMSSSHTSPAVCCGARSPGLPGNAEEAEGAYTFIIPNIRDQKSQALLCGTAHQ